MTISPSDGTRASAGGAADDDGDFIDSTDLTAAVPSTPQDIDLDSVLTFPRCDKPTLGVELELSLIDPTTGKLAPVAGEVLKDLNVPWAKPELFSSIVEINSGVCETVDALEGDLRRCLNRVREVCDARGLTFICTGTHPTERWREVPISPDARYQKFVRWLRWPAERMLICGMHVHVGMQSGEHAVALLNAMSCFLPHFLALSASSPFWEGVDTGMASARAKIFEGLPTAGLPPRVENWSEFVGLMRTFLVARTVSSIREIWWDIRPHPGFGTLELRICDGVNNLKDVCAIAAFAQALVQYLQNRYNHGEPLPHLRDWTLKENKWRAARHGEQAQLIRNEKGDQTPLRANIESWIERLGPIAEQLGSTEALQRVSTLLEKRPSYHMQRAHFQEHGSFPELVAMLDAEMRQGMA